MNIPLRRSQPLAPRAGQARSPTRLLAWTWVLGSVWPASAWAYVDPNAGGLLYQILFPLIVAIGAAWAGLRHRIGYWWARLRGRQPLREEGVGEEAGHAPAPARAAESPASRTASPAPREHD